MAFKYEDFVNAAGQAGKTGQFTAQELEVAKENPEYGLSVLGLMQNAQGAQTQEQRLLAQEAKNQLSKAYGIQAPVLGTGQQSVNGSFSGGTVQAPQLGRDTLTSAQLMEQLQSYGGYSYNAQDAYDQLLEAILNPQAFHYDPASDPRFATYKQTYLREGDRATENALAKASAATGGVPSSYAATAAAQAGSYYAGKVADVIPQLYEDAYSQYLNDQQLKLNGLQTVANDRAFDYQQYLDSYSRLQNQLQNLQNQEQIAYEQQMDRWNQNRAEQQDAYNMALAQYEMLGYATPEIAQILGINPDMTQKQVLALQKAMNAMGANIATDGILGNQTWTAFQNMGYMDAWPAYQAMMAQGLIDAQGNYIGPEVKHNYEPSPDTDTDVDALSNVEKMKKTGDIAMAMKTLEAAYREGLISKSQYNFMKNEIFR